VGEATTIRGALVVAGQARLAAGRARFAQTALVNGGVGILTAPRGRLMVVLTFAITDGRITEIEVIAAPERLRQLDLAVVAL